MTHTPTPWRVAPDRCFDIQTGDETLELATIVGETSLANSAKPDNLGFANEAEQKANAAFIVLAVNAHSKLVEALEQAPTLVELCSEIEQAYLQDDLDTASTLRKRVRAILGQINAALLAARPEQDICPDCGDTGTVYTLEDETEIGQPPGSSSRACPRCAPKQEEVKP